MTPPASARPAGSSAGYRLSWAREWLNDRFWVLPSALLAGGVTLAVLTAGAGTLGGPARWRGGLRVRRLAPLAQPAGLGVPESVLRADAVGLGLGVRDDRGPGLGDAAGG